MKVVFLMSRPGHVRNYEETLRILSTRGHRIHLAFSAMRPKRNDPPDLPQAEALAADCPSITFGQAPQREQDGWDRIGAGIRLFGDYARFLHPRYRDATLLRKRAAQRFVRGSGGRKSGLMVGLRRMVVRFCSLFSNEVVANALGAICRAGERAVRPSSAIRGFLATEQADLVLVTPGVEIGSNQVEYFKAAQSLGVPSALCVASWDNLTNKGVLRLEPDTVFVWNEIQLREAVELHDVPRERVVATGAPRFDEWFRRGPSRPPDEFKAAVGLDPTRPFLLYLCSSPFIAANEVAFVEQWLAALRGSGNVTLETVGVLVRPHPQNAAQWRDVHLAEDGAAIWPRSGEQVTTEDAKAGFYDSIAHSAAVVGVNTTALIEASILGRSVLTVLAPQFDGTQKGTLHYHYLREENGGFLREAATLGEHLVQLEQALGGEGTDPADVRRFVTSFVRPLGSGVSASQALADGIEHARHARRACTGSSFSGTVMHVGLAPFAAWARWRERPPRGPLRRRFAAWLARSRQARQAASWLVTSLSEAGKTAGPTSAGRDARSAYVRAERRARRTFAEASEQIVVGPWHGDPATELLYWIPYVRWLAEQHQVSPDRLLAVSNCGVPEWYEGIAAACVDGASLRTKPGSALEHVVTAFAGGVVEQSEVLRRSRHARVSAPGLERAFAPPAGYLVVVTRDGEANGWGDRFASALPGRRQISVVHVSNDHAEIEFEGASLLGRRTTDNPLGTLSATVAGARAVLGPPESLTIALAVCHGVRAIALTEASRDIDWRRVDLVIRTSHAIGSPFSILDVSQLELTSVSGGLALDALDPESLLPENV